MGIVEAEDTKKSCKCFKFIVGFSDVHFTAAQLPREYSSAIKGLVKEELENYGSDKTGKTDYALETAGGRIVKVIDTENYGSTVGLFGLTLCEGTNGPRAMIQVNVIFFHRFNISSCNR